MDTKQIPAGELINGRYRVVGVVGTTTMDITYEVVDEHIPGQGRRAMILSLHTPREPGQTGELDQGGLNILRKTREAQILGMLHHPAIPTLHDYFLLEDMYGCLITDLVQGTNLEQVMKQYDGVLPPRSVLDSMIQTCDIVGYLHSFNPPILFRDIQPLHLVLGPDNQITLTSFGIAMEDTPTHFADNVGTQGFAAPEQYEGIAEPRSDIFAMGATMHMLLTKQDPRLRAPFTFHQHPIAHYNAQATPEIEAVVMRCVEMKPENRYQSIQELKTVLVQLASSSGSVAPINHDGLRRDGMMDSSDRPPAVEQKPSSSTFIVPERPISVSNILGMHVINISMGNQGRLLRYGQFWRDLSPGRHAWFDLSGGYTVIIIDTRIHLLTMVVHGELPIRYGDIADDGYNANSVSIQIPLSISVKVTSIDTLLECEDPIALLEASVSTQVTIELSRMRNITTEWTSTFLPFLLNELQRWLVINAAPRTGLQVLEVLVTPPGMKFSDSRPDFHPPTPKSNSNRPGTHYASQKANRDRPDDRLEVFISHSHHDISFCRRLVHELRNAGAVVWYDEHDLEPGQLTARIQQALRRSSVFLPILSRNALVSTWVKDESNWAYKLYRRDQIRIILPITIEEFTQQDFDDWLYLEDFARVEAPMFQPYPEAEAIRRTLDMLGLREDSAAYNYEQPSESQPVLSLIDRGRILYGHGRYADALVLLMQATNAFPNSSLAWITLGATHQSLGQHEFALRAYQTALTLDPNSIAALDGKGRSLLEMRRYEEAIEAFDSALRHDPINPDALYAKSQALSALQRTDEALMTQEEALRIDPSVALGDPELPSTSLLSQPLGLQAPTSDL